MTRPSGAWRGRRVLITAGPTREHLDPVRFVTNGSSGAMGAALAAAARRLGARVTVVSGPLPSATRFPPGVAVVPVVSGLQMFRETASRFPSADLLIAAAAVGDWRPAKTSRSKMKKEGRRTLSVSFVANPDIVAELSLSRHRLLRRPAVVGFALETGRWLERARAKLERKGLDLIVANKTGSMGGPDTRIAILGWGSRRVLRPMSKARAAVEILKAAEPHLPSLGRRVP